MSIALQIRLEASRRLRNWLLLACALALVSVLLYLAHCYSGACHRWPSAAWLSLLVPVLAGVQLRRFWRRQTPLVLCIDAKGRTSLYFIYKNGDFSPAVPVRLAPHSIFWNSCLVVHWLLPDDTHLCRIILPDALTAGSFARLRLSLLWIQRQHELW
ncbi:MULTISPECIES: hypothetical protein [unclassified Undibacterium]|uniref:hypothetical protein n=1 Tax=unclassified Undibacterium TaxID=2630295 RepID=UPI002AC97646|nr:MULTISPECIES: hypothetical protein [unclassified Undibacterium]MEB0138583.1 hypothetical protein [Undibacterium sp. CCC2.1]MEB0171353.1 hypothetical protein [Undibacterium sp. CCC1.1]MEB0175347.1 hypothetical protein [Undibacterium sp. CCC3.4]MEB0214549.1 hypothetical protein [Undibacterium sp. 5I2]WPX43077.1 hypothetical protein RHM61_17105 [Undibacterium sp. CCC3.4]